MKKLTLVTLFIISITAKADALLTDLYIDSPTYIGFSFVHEDDGEDMYFILTPELIDAYILTHDDLEIYKEIIRHIPSQTGSNNDPSDFIQHIVTNTETYTECVIENPQPSCKHSILEGVHEPARSESIIKAIVLSNRMCFLYKEEHTEFAEVDLIPFYDEGEFIHYKDVDFTPSEAPEMDGFHGDTDYIVTEDLNFRCAIPVSTADDE